MLIVLHLHFAMRWYFTMRCLVLHHEVLNTSLRFTMRRYFTMRWYFSTRWYFSMRWYFSRRWHFSRIWYFTIILYEVLALCTDCESYVASCTLNCMTWFSSLAGEPFHREEGSGTALLLKLFCWNAITCDTHNTLW